VQRNLVEEVRFTLRPPSTDVVLVAFLFLLRTSPSCCLGGWGVIWTASRSEEQQNLKQCISVMCCEKQSILNKLVALLNHTTATSNIFVVFPIPPARFPVPGKQEM